MKVIHIGSDNMYTAVPCYILGKLHKQSQSDLPHCPEGLVETRKIIIDILKKQKVNPSYQSVAELPAK